MPLQRLLPRLIVPASYKLAPTYLQKVEFTGLIKDTSSYINELEHRYNVKFEEKTSALSQSLKISPTEGLHGIIMYSPGNKSTYQSSLGSLMDYCEIVKQTGYAFVYVNHPEGVVAPAELYMNFYQQALEETECFGDALVLAGSSLGGCIASNAASQFSKLEVYPKLITDRSFRSLEQTASSLYSLPQKLVSFILGKWKWTMDVEKILSDYDEEKMLHISVDGDEIIRGDSNTRYIQYGRKFFSEFDIDAFAEQLSERCHPRWQEFALMSKADKVEFARPLVLRHGVNMSCLREISEQPITALSAFINFIQGS